MSTATTPAEAAGRTSRTLLDTITERAKSGYVLAAPGYWRDWVVVWLATARDWHTELVAEGLTTTAARVEELLQWTAANMARGDDKTPWYSVNLAIGFEIIKPNEVYVVRTNAGEWRDPDLRVMRGSVLLTLHEQKLVRGKPIWVAPLTATPDGKPLSDWC